MKKLDRILTEALTANNLLNEQELETHLSEAQSTGESLKEYFLRKGVLTEKQILIALSQSLNTETIDFKDLNIETAVLEKIPTKFAWYYKVLPVRLNNNLLTVASSTPLDVKTQDDIRVHLGVDVDFVLAEENHLLEALKKYYGFASETIDRILTKDPLSQEIGRSDDGKWVEDIETHAEDPTVSNLVNEIILEAYKKRATDIHIEPYRNKVRFRYRIDGTLVDANLPDNVKHFLPQILSRIKILANLSITEKRMPQDGSAVVKTKEQHLDLRISTMPTPRGESIVIRILPTKVMLFSLEKLGFNPSSISQFKKLIQKPHGIIFITGPTGSGKTTTLYACLNEINSSKRKIITIEDPVEYEMDGITQVQVNPKVNFHFSTGLRSILRHDPDIIMVGEVRDPETAEIAIKTALTGHLVFSTLHTNDAASGITRLIDMGVEPYLVASSVESFVAQRLIRVLCSECKVLDENPMAGIKDEISRSIGVKETESMQIYKAVGCDHCNQTGFYGRIAVYEILLLNDAIRAAILEKPRSDYIKKIAMREGLKTLRQNGWSAVLNGITTPDEVLNVTVKDEYIQEKVVHIEQEEPNVSPHDTTSIIEDFRYNALQKKKKVTKQDEHRERVYPRVNVPTKVLYHEIEQNVDDPLINQFNEAVSENISAGGVQFLTKNAVKIGTVFKLKLELGSPDCVVECLGKVCRCIENNQNKQYSLGTYFLDITTVSRNKVIKFIEIKLKEEEKFGIH